MIRIFNHYVSKMAFILLLELAMLLATASVASAIWVSDGQGHFRTDKLYLSSLTFALVIIFSMSALGMYQHSASVGMRTTLFRIMPSFALGFALLSALIAVRPEIYFGRGISSAIFAIGATGVGPRPERAYFVDQIKGKVPYYDVRHSIKPGVTGLAQVRYQYGASIDDAIQKLQYDLYYVKNNSLFLDLLILIETVQVVLTGKGSR